MGDKAGINRSLNTIRTELEYLRDAGVVSPPQFQSIMAQLPQQGGMPSQYVDPRYSQGGYTQYPQQQGYPQQQQQNNYSPVPQQIAQAAQDPNHPANPSHPKHMEWASKLGGKFGNALVWGAGATFGGDIANAAFHDL